MHLRKIKNKYMYNVIVAYLHMYNDSNTKKLGMDRMNGSYRVWIFTILEERI
jgi:hypothetical protein